MKLRATLLLTLAALLVTGSLAFASPASPPQLQVNPAPGGLQLATPAPDVASCGTGSLAFLPAPLPSDTPVLCGGCSSVFCKGKALGAFCGPTTIGRCTLGPSCTTGGVTCLCQ